MRQRHPVTWSGGPDLIAAASEFRHVAAMGAGRFLRDGKGDAKIQGARIAKPKADLLETALKSRTPLDQETFSMKLSRNRPSFTRQETALLEDLARRPLDDASDQEFETLARDVLTTMADMPPSAASAESRRPERQPSARPEDPGRLQALLDAASRNRRAAVERAARKEAEFNAARDVANNAWSRVGKEATKAAIQLGATLVTKRGRPASPGLGAAYETYEAAMGAADKKQKELQSLRRKSPIGMPK